jgi:nucleotide-binding universal stress UspA family protein
MKKILVPVDFSTHTNISCEYALQISKASGAEIILFHSFFDQFYYSDGGLSTGFESGIMMTDELILDFYKQKERKLHELAGELRMILAREEKMELKIKCRMESGNPEVQIIRAIDDLKPDVIVMGSGGMGKKGMMAGSVARRIINHTSIPVIAVPDMDRFVEINNIAYMTAFDPDDMTVLPQINTMLSCFRPNIFCLHLLKNETEGESLKKLNDLEGNKALKDLEGKISFHTLKNDHRKETVKHFIAVHQIGLVAFIPHKRNVFQNLFYQGITREELFQMQIPIMAVRPA